MPGVVRALVLVLTLGLALGLSPPWGRAAAEEHDSLAGVLLEDRFYSHTIGRELPFRVYLPPDYFSGERVYPTLYLLHGAGGDYTEWTDQFLPHRADEMIRRGEIEPMIVVMPDGGGRTYWANWAHGGPQWRTYVVSDVVRMVDDRFRTLRHPAARAIGGHSMGGWGALHIAFAHPDIFGVVGAHSPSIRLEPDPDLWYLDGDTFWSHHPLALARATPDVQRLRIWMDVGASDGWRPDIETLHHGLEGLGVSHAWHILPGQHEAEYWMANVPHYLRFYSAALHDRLS